jgi:hypothetical protein
MGCNHDFSVILHFDMVLVKVICSGYSAFMDAENRVPIRMPKGC